MLSAGIKEIEERSRILFPNMQNRMMKTLQKICTLILSMILCSSFCITTGYTEAQPFSLPVLNENGFYSEAFCLGMNPEDTFEWNPMILLLLGDLSEEAKETVSQASYAGAVFSEAFIAFFPDGNARLSFRFTDQMYQALSTSALFSSIIQQSSDQNYSYAVNLEEQKVVLYGDDTVELTIHAEQNAFERSAFGSHEIFSVPQEVPEIHTENLRYSVLRNIAYGDDPAQVMDIYVPNDLDTTKSNGVIVDIYGGGWTSGDKGSVSEEARKYAEAGYIVLTPTMRNAFYDEEIGKTTMTVYDMLNDVQLSLRKFKEIAVESGWNVTQCAFRGTSSGANIALLYSYTRNADLPWFDTEEILPVRFVVDVVGPVDMHDSAWFGDESWPEEDRTLMTGEGAGPAYAMLLTGAANEENLSEDQIEEAIRSMSPVWYAQNGGAIPTLMGYSKRDIIQNPNNGIILKGYLDAADIPNDLYTFENSIHGYSADPETAEEFLQKSIEYAITYFLP